MRAPLHEYCRNQNVLTQIQNYTMFIVVLFQNNAVLQHLHVHFLLYGIEFYHNVMKLDIYLKKIYIKYIYIILV